MMSRTRRSTALKIPIATAAAALATVLTTPAANAIGQPAAVAPGCVRLEQWEEFEPQEKKWKSHAKTTNKCVAGTVVVKMVWAWARDGDCKILEAGDWATESRWGPHPYVEELRRC